MLIKWEMKLNAIYKISYSLYKENVTKEIIFWGLSQRRPPSMKCYHSAAQSGLGSWHPGAGQRCGRKNRALHINEIWFSFWSCLVLCSLKLLLHVHDLGFVIWSRMMPILAGDCEHRFYFILVLNILSLHPMRGSNSQPWVACSTNWANRCPEYMGFRMGHIWVGNCPYDLWESDPLEKPFSNLWEGHWYVPLVFARIA